MVTDVIREVLTLGAGAADLRRREQTRMITQIDDIADGIVTAIGSPAGLRDHSTSPPAAELTAAGIAEVIWWPAAAPAIRAPPHLEVDVVRRWPDADKARRLPGWEARIGVEEGVAVQQVQDGHVARTAVHPVGGGIT